MNDLTNKEQKAVRTALRFLRLRVGAWGPLAKALRYESYEIGERLGAGSMGEVYAARHMGLGKHGSRSARHCASSTR